MYVENRTKSPIFTHPVYLTPRWWGSPCNLVSAQGSQKTRMMGLSDGPKSFPIGLAVLIQYRSVTASHPPSHPASHVAVAITLYAKASSLKTTFSHHINHKCSFTCCSGLHQQCLIPLSHRVKGTTVPHSDNLTTNEVMPTAWKTLTFAKYETTLGKMITE